MEIGGDIGCSRVLHSWFLLSIIGMQVHEILGKVRIPTSCGLSSPKCTTSSVSVSVALPNIVTSTTHVVGDSISVDPYSVTSASLDHRSELGSGTISTIQLVGCWLVDEVPWIEFSILWPFIREYRFLRWEDLDSHVSSFTKEGAFLLNVGIWPSEELNNSSFLAIFVVGWLIDLVGLPEKICWLLGNSELFAVSINSLNN
jgi:hypothetical protein